MKLELGVGNRPTDGYLHQDIIELVPLSYKCQPWEINPQNNRFTEVLALGVMEHLRFEDFRKTVKNVYDLLEPGGIFLFDVPDITVWSEYLYKVLHGKEVPFTKEHILSTIYGWQRWPGDEHKSAWTRDDLLIELKDFELSDGLEDLKQRAVRNRFTRPEDAHIYIKAIK